MTPTIADVLHHARLRNWPDVTFPDDVAERYTIGHGRGTWEYWATLPCAATQVAAAFEALRVTPVRVEA